MVNEATGDDGLVLPKLKSFDKDERLLARLAVGRARQSDHEFHVRLFEAHVARILRATFPDAASSPWNLLVDGSVRIRIRSAAPGRSYALLANPTSDDQVDVWVLIDNPVDPPASDMRNVRFIVLSNRQVHALGYKSIAHHKLLGLHTPCTRKHLLRRVRQAAADRT